MFAPAKINLALDLLRRRDDGYHDLRTIFCAITLGDELTLSPATKGPRLSVAGPYAEGVPIDDRNLALRAALRVLEEAPAEPEQRARLVLHLIKNVPHGAGLGGGSSDGATALRLANSLRRVPLNESTLARLAAELGSDCAFFLLGGAALGEARGERLTALRTGKPLPLLLVIPPFAVNTRAAYEALRPSDLRAVTDFAALARWLADPKGEPPPLHNAFEAALHDGYPALAGIRAALLSEGAIAARLSGSGSASFGIFASAEARDAAAAALAATLKMTVIPAETIPSLGIPAEEQ